jgi:hypothetical protein
MRIRKTHYLLFTLFAIGLVYVVQDYKFHQRIKEDEKLIKQLLASASLINENEAEYKIYDSQIADVVRLLDTAKVRLLEYYTLEERPADYNELGMYCFFVSHPCGAAVPHELKKIYQNYGGEADFLEEIGLQNDDSETSDWFEDKIRNKSIPEIVLLLNTIRSQLIELDKKVSNLR